MVQRVFFSSYFEKETWRANMIRKSWEEQPDKVATGFLDHANYENIKKGGDVAIKKWIDDQLEETSVTVVLIGSEAFNRPYCKYAIEKSYERGNVMIGIYIHKLKDKNGNISLKGSNEFGEIGKDKNNKSVFFSTSYPTYDWVDDNGCCNLREWIEESARKLKNNTLALHF